LILSTLETLRQLLVLLQHALEMDIHVTVVGDKADGAVSQALAGPHVLHHFLQRQPEQCHQRFDARRRRRWLFRFAIRLGDARQVGGAAGHRFERLVLELANSRNPEFIHGVGEQQDLDALGLVTFDLRALPQRSTLSPEI
jgi:hypothetical protein